MSNKAKKTLENDKLSMPLLPLRDVVVFPRMVIPLFVGRDKSIRSLEAASKGKQIMLATQLNPAENNPGEHDIYPVGTICMILQMLRLPDGTVKVLVKGLQRGHIESYTSLESHYAVKVFPMHEIMMSRQDLEENIPELIYKFNEYAKLNKKISPDILPSLIGLEDPIQMGIEDPVVLVDTIAAHLMMKISEKQEILELTNLSYRINTLIIFMSAEIDLLQVQKTLRNSVEEQMKKNQREYILREQMTAIQKELGDIGEDGVSEYEDLKNKIHSVGMSEEAQKKAMAELNKLKLMPPMSAEATVSRNYIDWMISVPWKKQSRTKINLDKAKDLLNDEHYGLEKIKERILEYLAVLSRVRKLKGPVLCLVGPPGVGKTSLGKSIAKSTGRKFVRLSLGGMRDEAEIRGHRKTYIGAMPGKILQKLAKVEVKNPLFLLDEIDKISTDYRGDPSSALLEVLDPEQNTTFSDNYLEVDYDLSEIMFVATANSLNIPTPLLDRMEVIRIAGYTEEEKINIAMNYLVPTQIKDNGLKEQELLISVEALREIVQYYTREAGVRGLEREIAKLCRKIVFKLSTNADSKQYVVNANDIEQYLGVRKYRLGLMEHEDRLGQVTGLAWTEVGGDILTIEAAIIPGNGKIIRTGKLGDVMQESIQAALTVVRSRVQAFGIDTNFHEDSDLHIHVPEGATPKDGPSAGIGMTTAMVSILTKIPVRRDVAMTGEITLRGQVLPIGGLKEKLLAAKRAGILHVIIPHENISDLKEIPEHLYSGVEIHPVQWIDEVIQIALVSMPQPSPNKPCMLKSKRKNKDNEAHH